MEDQRAAKDVPYTTIHHMEWEVDRIQYKGLEFEYQAHRVDGQAYKALLSYDQSLARVRAAGFDDGHARPNEVFAFLIYGIEHRLYPQLRSHSKFKPHVNFEEDIKTRNLENMAEAIINCYDPPDIGNMFYDMQTGYGEWLSAAWQVERVGSRQFLTHYTDPKGLILLGETYGVQDNLRYSCKQVFDVTGSPLQTWIPLDRFDETLQVHLYTHRFADLPEEMRENEDPKRNAGLYLPPEGVIWPVARRCHGRFAIGCHKILRASRGVYSLGDEGAL